MSNTLKKEVPRIDYAQKESKLEQESIDIVRKIRTRNNLYLICQSVFTSQGNIQTIFNGFLLL